MQDLDPTQTDNRYENVRVISREPPAEEAAVTSDLPQYGASSQNHADGQWRVSGAGQQNGQVRNQAVAVAQPAPAPAQPQAHWTAPASAPATAPAAPATSAALQAPAPAITVTEPVLAGTRTPVEMVSWREELQVMTAPQERTVGTVKVRKYVTVEDFTGTVPIEYDTVQVIREPVSEQEAALLTPADIAELTQEVELRTQEALVTRRIVPIERVRLQVSRVKGEVTVSDALRSEHFEVDEPVTPNLQDAVRRVDAPYDGRTTHSQQTEGAGDRDKHSEGGKRRFGRRG
jgi:stress response protein YsnF